MTGLAAQITSTNTRTRSSLISDVALALLRGGLGVDFVAHGSQKIFGAWGGFGMSGTAKFFDSLGAHPGMLWAVLAAIVEFGGGIAMLLGLFTRVAGVAIAIDMLLAIALYNAGHGFFTETPTDGWEINYLILCMALAAALLGPGRYALATIVRGDGTNTMRRTIASL